MEIKTKYDGKKVHLEFEMPREEVGEFMAKATKMIVDYFTNFDAKKKDEPKKGHPKKQHKS